MYMHQLYNVQFVCELWLAPHYALHVSSKYTCTLHSICLEFNRNKINAAILMVTWPWFYLGRDGNELESATKLLEIDVDSSIAIDTCRWAWSNSERIYVTNRSRVHCIRHQAKCKLEKYLFSSTN